MHFTRKRFTLLLSQLEKQVKSLTTTIIIEKNVPCLLKDSTTLYADVYRPSIEGQFPTLLSRLIDGKDSHLFRQVDIMKLVQAGYVLVLQDVRGRHKSEGIFTPFNHELEDGKESINWVSSLPYSNGSIGMFGAEYSAFTQQTLATSELKHLKALFPIQLFNNQAEFTHKYGFFKLAETMNWALSLAEDEIKRKQDEQTVQDYLFHWKAYSDQIERFYAYFPKKAPLFKMLDASLFFYDLAERHAQTPSKQVNLVPSYFVTGWFDSFLQSTLDAFTSSSSEDKLPHTLLIGPWSTGLISEEVGERYFGKSTSLHSIANEGSLTDLHIRWFDRWLKLEENGIEHEAPVQLFVMGINKWRKEKQWPLPNQKQLQFFFTNQNGANKLLLEPNAQFSDSISCAPKVGNPISKRRFQNMPVQQHLIEDGAFFYQSESLTEATELIGAGSFFLQIDAVKVTVDLYATLYDVSPTGDMYNLTEGIVTIKEHAELQNVVLHLHPTANQFKKGHRIALKIEQAPFPKYVRHAHLSTENGDLLDSTAIKLSSASLTLPISLDPLT